MKFLAAKQSNAPSQTQYASATDFCRIFERDMNRLYLLSLLLTADHELAENCFVAGLEDSQTGNPVFKEWARSWARRAIITNAIRMIRPRPEDHRPASGSEGARHDLDRVPAEFAPVLGLGVFERFVFVLSVLEGYRQGECKVLLSCSSSEIAEAQIRAFEQLGTLAEKYSKLGNVFSFQSNTHDSESTRASGAAALAVPA